MASAMSRKKSSKSFVLRAHSARSCGLFGVVRSPAYTSPGERQAAPATGLSYSSLRPFQAMLTDSDSLLLRGRPVAQSEFRSWLDHRYSGHPGRRTPLNKLGIIDLVAPHDVKADGQLARSGFFRIRTKCPRRKHSAVTASARRPRQKGLRWLSDHKHRKRRDVCASQPHIRRPRYNEFYGQQN